MMMTGYEFKESVLEYLKKLKELSEAEIMVHRSLDTRTKVEMGLAITDCIIESQDEDIAEFSFSENNTKLRPGDFVTIRVDESWVDAVVLENGMERLLLRPKSAVEFLPSRQYMIEVREMVLLDPLIKLIESIEDGTPGYSFLSVLSAETAPKMKGLFGGISVEELDLDRLNDAQKTAVEIVAKKPQIHCIQGPPGTGKSEVLASIALAFSDAGESVAVIAKTHQAVNNAMNKIAKLGTSALLIKIGEFLKAEELHPKVRCNKTYNEFFSFKKTLKRKPNEGDIIGMTHQSSIVNLGLKNKGFAPTVVLVDEASQIQLCEAVSLGTIGAATVVFIGDDKQMPPIFHEAQEKSELSKSVFSYLIDLYPKCESKLNVTYRMNKEITEMVSSNFYEPFNEHLISSEFAANRKLKLHSDSLDERINSILASEKSIHVLNVTTERSYEDSNEEEADFVAEMIYSVIKAGLRKEDVAAITPYRRQVRLIREKTLSLVGEGLPLIDTVERLQGQDVSLIIISMCTSSYGYYMHNRDFLLNPNRLNVMISRAKMKVVILKSDIIEI